MKYRGSPNNTLGIPVAYIDGVRIDRGVTEFDSDEGWVDIRSEHPVYGGSYMRGGEIAKERIRGNIRVEWIPFSEASVPGANLAKLATIGPVVKFNQPPEPEPIISGINGP